jgi:YidC/Oxa1 family membrane protein insertase
MAVSALLVLAMTATTFTTQKQLMSKNMPADALTGPYAQQQKMLLYVLPVAFGLGGVAFPIGVLLYWTTSNLWTMGQQFYVIRNNPAPGTPAFEAKQRRDREKREKHGETPSDEEGDGGLATLAEAERRPAQREQPKRLTKAERQRAAAKKAASVKPEVEPGAEPEPVVETKPDPAPTRPIKKTNHPPTKKKKQGGRR